MGFPQEPFRVGYILGNNPRYFGQFVSQRAPAPRLPSGEDERLGYIPRRDELSESEPCAVVEAVAYQPGLFGDPLGVHDEPFQRHRPAPEPELDLHHSVGSKIEHAIDGLAVPERRHVKKEAARFSGRHAEKPVLVRNRHGDGVARLRKHCDEAKVDGLIASRLRQPALDRLGHQGEVCCEHAPGRDDIDPQHAPQTAAAYLVDQLSQALHQVPG